MDSSTGQRLAKARLAKGLSVDEVAHATKLRPDKVLALEHDDYSRFPNNAYVKGFLQIYGRFLGVDVRAALSEIESPSPVNIADYQYLNSVPDKKPERLALRRRSGKPSLTPLIVFIVLCAVVGGGGYIYLNARRLGDLERLSSADAPPDLPAATPAPALVKKATPVKSPAPLPEAAAVATENAAETPAHEAAQPTPPAATKEVAAADHEFIAQTPETTTKEPAAVNEVVIEPVRKTWVTVRTGDASSTPIFEDFLYTNAPSLKLRGPRFFIMVRDEGAVNIRKNGNPIAYRGAGVTIQ